MRMMKMRIDQRITGVFASSVLVLSACEGKLDVVDDLDQGSADLAVDQQGGSGSAANAACACASSDSLLALSCGGGEVPLLDNDVVQTTPDGGVVAFTLCSGTLGCSVAYWRAGSATVPISSGLLLGLSASGERVLTSGDGTGGLQLVEVDGTDTAVPLDVIIGRGALSAAGDVVVGTSISDNTLFLARSTPSGVEEIAHMGRTIARAYVNADASAVVGSTDLSPDGAFRWTEQGGIAFDFPGVPEGVTVWPESLSADGSVVAGRALPGGTHFRWTASGSYEELASASWRSETLLSTDGSVVAGSLGGQDPDSSRAFRWTGANGAAELTPGIGSALIDMSDDGSVVVASSEFLRDPLVTFVWDTTHGLRTLSEILQAKGVAVDGWELGEARALSADGNVLVGRATCGGVPTLYRVEL
jgi:hypothetical protein